MRNKPSNKIMENKIRVVFDKDSLEETVALLRKLSLPGSSERDIETASASENLDEIIGFIEGFGGIQGVHNAWDLVQLKSAIVAAPLTGKMETLVGLQPSDLLRKIVAASRSGASEVDNSP